MVRFSDAARDRKAARGLRAIPRGVWALGFVSMFMDVSSEMIHSLLPVFLVLVLGTSATALGVLEGVAEATVHLTKMFSGALSDWFGKRKTLALAGYGVAALTKPLFPLANSYAIVFVARLVDRVGKGVRGAPRDALVADLEHFSFYCIAYPQWVNQAEALSGVMVAMASEIACCSDSTVRAFRQRSFCFTLPQHGSIGLKSGEYGGKYSSFAPVASMSSRTPGTLGALRLSMTTIWPGCRRGHNTCSR